MIKKKCMFIDHKYHSTTNSTRFLIDILSSEYEIEVLFLEDFSDASFQKMLSIKTDLYLVFQYDFLAPFLLSNNKKVLIVPMYDGTGEMPPFHWLTMRGGLFINFSQMLHKTHTGLGLNSIYCRYYPNPDNYPKFVPSVTNGNSLFFWERQPQVGLCVDWLAYNINKRGFGPKQIHIHQAPDPGQYSKRHSSLLEDIFPGRQVTTSSWFKNKSEFLATLTQFGVYVAPRKAEGIGFSFIDAMACGLVVCAHDKPTMNEYVIHNKTGILFNDELPDIKLFDLAEIRNESMRSFVEGYDNWCRFIPLMLSSVRNYLSTPMERVLPPMSSSSASQISDAFFSRPDIYMSLIFNLIANLRENEIWRTRFQRPKLSTRLPMKLRNHPVLSQVLLEMYSKRKRVI